MRPLLAAVFLAIAVAAPTRAQTVPGFDNAVAGRQQRIGDKHYKLIGGVELKSGDTELYADEADWFTDEDRLVASGNVVFVQGGSRIAADRVEYNSRTRTGTFYNASGFASIKGQPQAASSGGIAVPQMSNQETDVYFYGDTVAKIGPQKYKITNGGFTTCVQPTPRWMLTSKTVVLNVDHYTLLRDAVFSVKGVPMLYTPVLYYPTKKEDRATGFLIPTYGSTTLRGHSIHNAFFWAIDRSQDATFMHDWFSNTGQGIGSEYRYNFGGGSDGDLRANLLNEHEATYALPTGGTSTQPAERSYRIIGAANQSLPFGLRARGRADYFSSLRTMQTFNSNIADASRTTRTYGGNIVGAWGTYSLNTTVERTEYFYPSIDSSAVSGSWPRVAVTRGERPLIGSNLYFSVGGEYASLLSTRRNQSATFDLGFSRFDVTPQVRFPFKKWQWFTVNSSLAWRDTFYTRSLAVPNSTITSDEDVNRRFFTLQSQILGPVFNRVWDTPNSGYAEKFKHSVEPFLNVQRTSSIDNFNQIIRGVDGTDSIVGGVTQYSYGINNRFYAKRREGQLSQAREIFDLELVQTYYTNQLAAQFDPRYNTSFSGAAPSKFSPIQLSVRALPTNDINATLRAEFDSKYLELRTISVNGSYSWSGRLQTTATWSKRAFIKELKEFNDPSRLDHSINSTTSVHTTDNRLGGIYGFDYDVLKSMLRQQRISAFYNAQCCGLAFEYQTYNFNGVANIAVPADHRFFLSFTLAGLGNFSPFNGALSGIPR